MILRHLTSAFTALVLAGSAVAVATGPAQASDDQRLGKRSLAKVLAADGRGFDKNAGDFDILDNAVRAVLAADPDSPVAVLADGKVKLTAFAPTDAAFRRLTTELTGKQYDSERRVFNKLAKAAGVETIEDVLLYHVVPGAPITYRQAKAADGAKLETALEETVQVRVRNGRVIVVDKDTDDRNARVIKGLKNINKGNRQIAHGVDRVLRPIDLP
ncbi:MAG TPA: fasciclin domain-containing protein [Nocardioidaceae bacterium]|nr:fasciclin domain-containing protein [Nocardioidaceae bacterium]